MFGGTSRACRRISGWRRLGFAVFLFVSFIGLSCSAVAASNALPEVSENTKGDSDLPPYEFNISNGLYATIAGYALIKDVELKQDKKFKLKIDSFKQKVPVHAVIQNRPAPLVVVLLGVDGRADSKLGKLWPSWYAAAGYNVLWFDSTFQPSFIEISGHGVTGNLVAESERVAEIVNNFINQKDVKSKVTRIGIVGMSYGGIEALVLGKMARDGRLPFTVEGIQSYSPPIRLQKTGELIDKWYREDRWNYTLVDLATKLADAKPSADGKPPFEDGMMRAGIAAAFRLGLADVIVRNDAMYKLNLLPSGNTFDDDFVKQEYASTWGYTKFMNDLSYPYWQRRLNYNSISDLTDPISLPTLLSQQPSYAEVVIAADDPFNTPEDLAALKETPGLPLTVLPAGGHLGFAGNVWTRAKLMTVFKGANDRQAASNSAR